jgi:HK97 family phage portal protein
MVSFTPIGINDYAVMINGKAYDKDDILHFRINTDPTYLWKGRGFRVILADLIGNLAQARKTEKAFFRSEYKPSLVVKVDALTEEFASAEGRQRLIDSYMKPAEPGQPWVIPAEQFQVEQVRPLSLADLAIADTVTLDKKAVAAIIGVPPYMLGVGEYNAGEYNAFIKNVVMPMCKSIAQELTKKLLINPAWYWQFNAWALIDYDMAQVSNLLLAGADRGFVSGDEWRDRMHMSPAGLKEYKILENYIPYDMSGNQAKLNNTD